MIFDDVRHEGSLILLLSLTDPDTLKQAKFTDHEINIIKILALEKLHRQRTFKEEVVAVYTRSLRAHRKKRTSPDCLKIRRNCINTLDFSIFIQIIILQ